MTFDEVSGFCFWLLDPMSVCGLGWYARGLSVFLPLLSFLLHKTQTPRLPVPSRVAWADWWRPSFPSTKCVMKSGMVTRHLSSFMRNVDCWPVLLSYELAVSVVTLWAVEHLLGLGWEQWPLANGAVQCHLKASGYILTAVMKGTMLVTKC
jgi:hypothetical protein